MKPLTVIHVMRHFHPVLAGAAERFRRYAPGLRERGISTSVITSRSDPKLPEYEVLEGNIQVHRVNTVRADRGTFDDKLLFSAARNLLLSNKIYADVVQSIEASPSIAPDLWQMRAAGYGLVHVSTMVGIDDANLGLLRRIKARLRHGISLLPFHKLVVSTSQMEKWSAHMGAYGRKMTVISHGVDTTRFHPLVEVGQQQPLRLQLGLPPRGLVVLFVGGLLPRKGLHLLLEAWPNVVRGHPEACLVILGPSDRPTVIDAAKRMALLGYQEDLRILALKAPPGSVIFVGERPDVEQFYRAADVFVLPSAQEGMANVVLEAFASGLPCVLTQCVGLPVKEFGQIGKEFVCVARESGALGEGLLTLLASKASMEMMGRRARRWAEQHFGLDLTLDRYRDLYQGFGRRVARGWFCFCVTQSLLCCIN